ncbi:hypothetical protein [Streptomyces sp. NPDC018036]|uniref:hypothetical protein n=1 Tax=Streptomyces sp. NPDC018036 TaxID=3365035 RepID=UPI003798C5A1
MASNRQPFCHTLGTPTHLVVYRTPDGWRYAVYFTGPDGIADGALAGPPPSSEPGITQAALLHKAEEPTRRQLEVLWRASDRPDYWTATVTERRPVRERESRR